MSRRPTLILAPVAAALLLGACSGSTPATEPPASSAAVSSATPSPTSTPATSSPAEGSAAPTALDPCQLVTAAEASTLAGASYGAGTESTSDGTKICTYSSTIAVVNVIVAQAPDAATAQANWDQEKAQAEAYLKKAAPSGVSLTFNTNDVSVTGADRAAVVNAQASFQGVNIGISAIYVLKGGTFFTFSDLALGHAAASASALEAQAVTTVGRVP